MAKITNKKIFTPKWYHVVIVKYLWILITVIIVSLFSFQYFFVIKPKLIKTTAGGEFDFNTSQRIFEEQQIYYEKLKKLKFQADQVDKEELIKLDYVLEKKIDMSMLLKQIKILADQTDMDFIGFSIFDEEQSPIISLSFRGGNYQKIKSYLKLIETNIRVMDIIGIEIKELGNFFNIKIKSYFLE